MLHNKMPSQRAGCKPFRGRRGTKKSPPLARRADTGSDDEKALLPGRIVDLYGSAKLMIAGITDPRIVDAAFAAKLGCDRSKQHVAAARTGWTPQNARDGQTSVHCNIITHG
jgi:hypothetical protein